MIQVICFIENVSKINDCDANGCSNLGKEEIIERCKLATVFRLVDIYGWCETIFNHISVWFRQCFDLTLNKYKHFKLILKMYVNIFIY